MDMVKNVIKYGDFGEDSINRCFLWDLADLNMPDKLNHNNIILLGDAGHTALPMCGCGLSTSFEDVMILSQLLVKHGNFKDNSNNINNDTKSEGEQGDTKENEQFQVIVMENMNDMGQKKKNINDDENGNGNGNDKLDIVSVLNEFNDLRYDYLCKFQHSIRQIPLSYSKETYMRNKWRTRYNVTFKPKIFSNDTNLQFQMLIDNSVANEIGVAWGHSLKNILSIVLIVIALLGVIGFCVWVFA